MFKKTLAVTALSLATLAGATAANVLPVAQADTGVQLAACKPCAAKNPCNPCAAKNPCNPCAAKNPCNPCNPCAAKNPCNPCNPCAAKKKSN